MNAAQPIVKARYCKQGTLYRMDDKEVLGIYTPLTPCQVVVDGIEYDSPSKCNYRHFAVFHPGGLNDGTHVQGAMVEPDQDMIEVGELPKISV